MNLSGKQALITGGARRIGRELAVHLSSRGCEVIVHYNRSVREAETLRDQIGCRVFQADFSSISISDLVKRFEQERIDADILINNASHFAKCAWKEIKEENWDIQMQVDLKMPFFLSQHFGRKMKKKGEGKILNMVDVAAQRPYLNYLPYSIAKRGVEAMTQAFARALAPEVQVNAIAPGTILFEEGLPEEARQKLLRKIPAGRTATIQELLRTVDFLLSDADYITGQIIVLDGGRSLTW
jgi:pteridine reductase